MVRTKMLLITLLLHPVDPKIILFYSYFYAKLSRNLIAWLEGRRNTIEIFTTGIERRDVIHKYLHATPLSDPRLRLSAGISRLE